MSTNPRTIGTVALAVALVSATAIAGADEPLDPSAEVTVVRRCLVEYERNTPISAMIFGVLKQCDVVPGARVKAGQVLGRLQDDDIQAEIRLREAEADSDVEVRLSEARHAQFQNTMERTAALINRNAASRELYNIHRLETAAAALEIEKAKYNRRLAALHLDQSRAMLRTRELVSPHDGVLTAVNRRRGETVAPRDPIFQVVDTDHLRVVGLVDVTEVWRLKVGQAVRVIPEVAGAELPVEHQVFPGRLAFIDSQIDPLTRTFKVHVQAENRDGLLRAGMEARIEIDPARLTDASARAALPHR